LRLFERLQGGAQDVSSIAAEAKVPEERLRALLRAAAALQLLEERPDGRYGLGVLGATMTDNQSLLALVEHHAMLYEDLRDPVALFANPTAETAMSRLWPYAGGGSAEPLATEDVADYTNLMAASQAMIAEQVMDAVSFRDRRRLLDIGGGAGAFAIAVARRWPQLEITIADLPAVADIARKRIAAAGMEDRIEVVGVDAAKDSLPGGYDSVSLVRILHDHDEPMALSLLAAAKTALNDDGMLLVAEPMADAPGAGELISAYFNVYLLAMGSGRPRRFDELSKLLEKGGFTRIQRRRTSVPLITGVVVARG
jgi:demethylspheroidene O-methyltransferase